MAAQRSATWRSLVHLLLLVCIARASADITGPQIAATIYPLLQKGTPLPHVGDSTTGPQCLAHGHTAPLTLPGYTWFSSPQIRRKAQVNRGDPSRLRVALNRYRTGQNLTVTFIGGSITAGQGAADGKGYPWWAEEILSGYAGRNIRVHNGAVPGTLSAYMSVCHNVHVPRESDIIFVEYTVNDHQDDQQHKLAQMDNPVRRAFERLVRKLLTYPRKPAIILVHSFMWHRSLIPSGLYWPSSERDFHEFATYYGLGELSVKTATWRLMYEGVRGFMVDKTRSMGQTKPPTQDLDLKGRVFYWDSHHPDGLTGHKFMGEMVAQALLDALAGVEREPVTDEDTTAANAELPPPLLPNNWQSVSDCCFVGPQFRSVVVEDAGWEFKDEGKDPSRPKLGYVSRTPGSILKIGVSTMAGSTAADKQNLPVTVVLSHLKSYIDMGKASVTCVSGCICERSQFNGHHEMRTSQLYLHEFQATQHTNCIIAIQVLPETQSGGHKVKVAGLVISDEGGHSPVHSPGLVSMAVEGSSRNSSGGTFEIREWIKG